MENLFIVIGILPCIIIGWLWGKSKSNITIQKEKEASQKQFNDLEVEFAGFKASANGQLQTAMDKLDDKQRTIDDLNIENHDSVIELQRIKDLLSTANAYLESSKQTIDDKTIEIADLKKELTEKTNELNHANNLLATAIADNRALNGRLDTQKGEMEELGKKFNLEFENIANTILETKTQKFTELNKTNIKNLLEPLGLNIEEFKKTVNETYIKESRERFSLGVKVKELADLNQIISDEARNLTKALKGDFRTQGRWGEMILESILEKSGLRKNEQYFMQSVLLDDQGIPLRTDSEGKKMIPDAVIKYPDQRSVIIDSKVSLNAFTRYIATDNATEQSKERDAHVTAIKNHIIQLSTKGYDDYNKALDFVMMFIPSEPAYMVALQGDANLWNFAYDRRVLLLNFTNLIISLKLIVDLWKRENQNQNAQEIAERGAKLYDKFVSFVSTLEDIGIHLDKAQGKYQDAHKHLTSGSDNLIVQATKFKTLGLKNKKDLSAELVLNASFSEFH